MEVMNVNMEKNFFTFILDNPIQFQKVENYFFKNNDIQFIYTIIRDEYLQSKNVPSPQQIIDMIKLNDPENKIPNDVIKIILKNDISDKSSWIEERFKAWKISNLVRNNTMKVIDEIRGLHDIDLENAQSVLSKIKNIYNNIPLIDDDDMDLGDDFDDPESHKQDIAKYKIPTGWSSVDKILSGGWDMSTFNVLMGETNIGKCCVSETNIKIRNKKTNKIYQITIGDFYKMIKLRS
jgi:hypothetical protein